MLPCKGTATFCCNLLKKQRLMILQTRDTNVFIRSHPPNLYRKHLHRRLKGREYIYELQDPVQGNSTVNIILTSDVEGIGFSGDVLSVDKELARFKLFPPKLAIYASPTNVAANTKFKETLVPSDVKQGVFATKTMRQIGGMNVRVPMNPDHSWTLQPSHVRIAMRLAGVEVPMGAITLPADPITKPCAFPFNLLVNKAVTVQAKGIVYNHYNNWLLAPDEDRDLFYSLPPSFPPEVLTPEVIPYVKEEVVVEKEKKKKKKRR